MIKKKWIVAVNKTRRMLMNKLKIKIKTKYKTEMKENKEKCIMMMNQTEIFGNLKDTNLKFLTLTLTFLKKKRNTKIMSQILISNSSPF